MNSDDENEKENSITSSGSESESDQSKSDQSESDINDPNDPNELSGDDELDGIDVNSITDVTDDFDGNESDSDESDDSHNSASKTKTTNQALKRNKKSAHLPEAINTEFNNPENTNYLEKLNNGMRNNFVVASHPESITHNLHDVKRLSLIKRNSEGIIDDPHHRMIPFITKYEMTRILGVRAQQIDNGAQPTIPLDNPELISGYFIAKQEFTQNKLPFIIKRSFPGNGGVEYWNVCDLDVPFII